MQLPSQYLVIETNQEIHSSEVNVFSLLRAPFDWPACVKTGNTELHFKTQALMDPSEQNLFGGKAVYFAQ